MLTIDQIRAARALLDWSQQDLAEHADLSQTGIARIENKTNKPNSKTLQKIESAFDRAGIEFIIGGVRKVERTAITYTGQEGFARFRDDVLTTVKHHKNPDICITNLDERLFDKWGDGEVNKKYRDEMAQIKDSNPNLKFRSLVLQGDTHFSAARHSQYKWLPENSFGYFPFYVYGDKVAMITFEENDVNIFILNNSIILKFYREKFEKMWSQAIDPEDT
jgi:transcriptional regulator with XRE-family HTH domain